VYYTNETLEKDLTDQGYTKIERKPWNVKEGDVLILSQYGMGFMNSGFLPVEVTVTGAYPEYHRTDTIPNRYTKTSRKTFRFYHKPLNPTNQKHMINWFYTEWYSTDTVEIWRKH